MARSGLPSRLKSPVVIESGLKPVFAAIAEVKPPAPLPVRTETLSEPWLAVARSVLPSPLKSPVLIERGCVPVLAAFTTEVNPPAPSPVRTETLFEP